MSELASLLLLQRFSACVIVGKLVQSGGFRGKRHPFDFKGFTIKCLQLFSVSANISNSQCCSVALETIREPLEFFLSCGDTRESKPALCVFVSLPLRYLPTPINATKKREYSVSRGSAHTRLSVADFLLLCCSFIRSQKDEDDTLHSNVRPRHKDLWNQLCPSRWRCGRCAGDWSRPT